MNDTLQDIINETKAHDERMAQFYDKLKVEALDGIKRVSDRLARLPDEMRKDLLKSEDVRKAFAALGFQRATKKRTKAKAEDGATTTGAKSDYDSAKLAILIGPEGMLQQDVQAHFKISKPTILEWGKKWVGDGNTIARDKVKKISKRWFVGKQ